MVGNGSDASSRGWMISMRGVVLLLVIALMAAALAACGGDGEPDGDGGGDETESRQSTEGKSDRSCRQSDSATAEADDEDEDEDEPEPTRRGLLGSGRSQPATGPGATEDADGAVSTQIEDGGGPRVKYTSVSAGYYHRCGMRGRHRGLLGRRRPSPSHAARGGVPLGQRRDWPYVRGAAGRCRRLLGQSGSRGDAGGL